MYVLETLPFNKIELFVFHMMLYIIQNKGKKCLIKVVIRKYLMDGLEWTLSLLDKFNN